MIRKIIKIDEEKCNGCGLCITGCHEGALKLIDGKARLVSDSYCDGLGACLPDCPTGALKLIEREAEEFDEETVKKNQSLPCGCPGSNSKTIEKKNTTAKNVPSKTTENQESELRQWPVQIKLVPASASYFDNCHLLVAADCTAYAYPNIHADFMKNKITIIGCPKLDNTEYSEKLSEILKLHEIKSVTVLRMEVPCCGGIVQAVKTALINSGKMIPWTVVNIATDGQIISE